MNGRTDVAGSVVSHHLAKRPHTTVHLLLGTFCITRTVPVTLLKAYLPIFMC